MVVMAQAWLLKYLVLNSISHYSINAMSSKCMLNTPQCCLHIIAANKSYAHLYNS